MKALKNKFNTILLPKIISNLHYVGLIIVCSLIYQTYMTSELSQSVINESIRQQNELRNISWANLLTQRVTILALSPMVTKDPSTYEQADRIIESFPELLESKDNMSNIKPTEFNQQISFIQKHIQEISQAPINSQKSQKELLQLIKNAEDLGTKLNDQESQRWFSLVAKNKHLLEDLKKSRTQNYIGYGLFIFYLLFLKWLTARKQAAEKKLLEIRVKETRERLRSQGLQIEKETAEKANKAKSMFLANMSHELRTPMHGILSYARFGQQKIETATKEKLKSYFDEIYESGSRLMALLNDLLDLSKLEAGKAIYTMKENSLKSLVSAVTTEIHAFAHEKELKIDITKSESEYIAVFDNEKIMQVVRNLLSNAIKFSQKGTTVQILLNEDNSNIECHIINEGIGIPETELQSIFDKFVQSSKTKTGAGGTGLGLAISKEIIEHHSGRIWAENMHNGRTKFVFKFPKNLTVTKVA